MKRRDFLKLIGIAPIAPSVLAAKEKPFRVFTQEMVDKATVSEKDYDIPKDKYGWVQICCTTHYAE